MATNKRNVRQSFSTPQGKQHSVSARRSLSQVDLQEANETLFSTVMNDPFKKVVLMQLLSCHTNGGKDVMELLQRKPKSVTKPKHCFSPISVHRKKVLASKEIESASPAKKVYSKSNVPFDRLLNGVVAYVEIISKGQDRSAGVKALVKSMGGTVTDTLRRGITHAIFKDVSYETYKRANLVRAHLVSVLWLEAVRKNHCRVPEQHYPALGPEACNSNVSLLCEELQKDYAEVVKDEEERSRNLEQKISQNLSIHFAKNPPDKDGSSKSSSPAPSENFEGNMMKTPNKDEIIDDSFQRCQVETPPQQTPRQSRRFVTTRRKTLHSQSVFSQNESQADRSVLSSTSKSSRKKSMYGSINLHVSSGSDNVGAASESMQSVRVSSGSKKNSGVSGSEDIGTLRISSASSTSSKRRTTASSVLSSLRISTDSKLANGMSESLESLRISDASSKRKTPESADSSPLITSRDSDNNENNNKNVQRLTRSGSLIRNVSIENKEDKSVLPDTSKSSKNKSINDSINLHISSGSNNVGGASESMQSLRLSSGSKKNRGVSGSEDIGSLRISLASTTSSKRRTTASSVLSSLRISTDSKLANGVSEPIGSLRISDSSSKRKTSESADLSPLNLSPDSDNNENNNKNVRRLTRSSSLQRQMSIEYTSDKGNDSDVSWKSENKENAFRYVTERKRRQVRLNFSSSSDDDVSDIEKTSKVKLTDGNNLNIAPIYMTSNAKKLYESLIDDNTSINNGSKTPKTNTPTNNTPQNQIISKGKTPKKSMRKSDSPLISNFSKEINLVASINELTTSSESDYSDKNIDGNSKSEDQNLKDDDKYTQSPNISLVSNIEIKPKVSRRTKIFKKDANVEVSNISVPKTRKSTKLGDTPRSTRKSTLKNAPKEDIKPKNSQSLDISNNSSSEKSDDDVKPKVSRRTTLTSQKEKNDKNKVEIVHGETKSVRKSRLYTKNEIKTSTQNRNLNSSSGSSSSDDSTKNKNPNRPKARKRKLYAENEWLENNYALETSPSKKLELDKIMEENSPSNIRKTQSTEETVFKTPGKPVRTKRVHSDQSQNVSNNIRASPRTRRSTMDFLPKELLRSPRSRNTTPIKRKTGIVCSRFHTGQVTQFTKIVQQLGTFLIENDVTEKTSHLVLGEPKRTVNALRALARGCWILKPDWIHDSLKIGKWLPEDNYEMTEFSTAVQRARQERQAFGKYFAMDVFSKCGRIYISKSSRPKCSDLQDLVTMCKGQLTTIYRNANVIVGEYVAGEVKCVGENWILDCIQFYETMSFESYLITSAE